MSKKKRETTNGFGKEIDWTMEHDVKRLKLNEQLNRQVKCCKNDKELVMELPSDMAKH